MNKQNVNPQQPTGTNQPQPQAQQPQVTQTPQGSYVQQPQPQAQQPQQQPANVPTGGQTTQQLQEQVKQLQDNYKQLSTFVDDASLLISAVYQDPKLKEQTKQVIQQRVQASNPNQPQPQTQPQPQSQQPQNQPQPQSQQPQDQQPQDQQPQDQQPQVNPMLNSVDLKMRDDIVQQLEGQLGYTSLEAGDKKSLRSQVEKRLNQWGTSVMTAPVDQLTTLLKDAYLLSDMGKAKEQGRVEALVSAHQNAQGAFPAMNTSTPTQEASSMTPHHEEWSEKLKVDVDKVAENLKEFEATGKIVYKPPQQQQVVQQPVAPSGSPAPPAPQQPVQQ